MYNNQNQPSLFRVYFSFRYFLVWFNLNKISNLRLANKQQNAYNCQVHKNNTSGFRGVSWHKASNKWRATCSLQGKTYNLGVYITAEEASIVYEEFVKEHHGEFYVY